VCVRVGFQAMESRTIWKGLVGREATAGKGGVHRIKLGKKGKMRSKTFHGRRKKWGCDGKRQTGKISDTRYTSRYHPNLEKLTKDKRFET